VSTEIHLASGSGWGSFIAALLPCGHRVELLREWIAPTGRVGGRIACTEAGCRRVFERVLLDGWPPRVEASKPAPRERATARELLAHVSESVSLPEAVEALGGTCPVCEGGALEADLKEWSCSCGARGGLVELLERTASEGADERPTPEALTRVLRRVLDAKAARP
jgi:hypothetical protein